MWPFFILFCSAIVDYSLAVFDPTTHANWNLLKKCDDPSTSRIVRGQEAALGEFPWMAGLVYMKRDETESKFLCSGTILNKNTIVTTANCVARFPAEVHYLLYVVLGNLGKLRYKDCTEHICAPEGQVKFLKEIIYHKQFDADKNWNDVALLRVWKEIQFNENVAPICVPWGNLTTSTFVGERALVAGWGVTNPANNQTSEVLRKISLPIRDPSVCTKLDGVKFDENFQFCVGGDKAGPGPCFNDGGGPLTIVRDGKPYLIGIFSFNGINGVENCGALGNPPVFVKVSAYLSWILDNLKETVSNYASSAVYQCGEYDTRCDS